MARRSDKRFRILPPGKFGGKKLTFASTEEVQANDDVAAEFMSAVFDLEPGDYLITDESDVLDFTPFDSADASEIWCRIEATYGINQIDVGSGRLVRIFESIAKRRSLQ